MIKKMMKKIALMLVIISMFTSFLDRAFSQERIDLDLTKIINMALSASEDYQINKNKIRISESKYQESKSALYPHLNSTATWCNNFKYPNNPLLLMGTYEVEGNINMSQLLYSFGRVSNAIKAAQKESTISQLNKEAQELDVIFNAKVSYFAALLAEKSLIILQESLNNSLRNKDILEQNSIDGRISKKDNIKISADISARKPMVSNARAARISAIKILKNIIGEEEGVEIKLIDRIEDRYAEEDRMFYIKAFEKNSPILKALQESIYLTEHVIRIKKAEFRPLISLYASWTNVGVSKQAHIGRDNFNDYGVAGVAISFPIFNGGEKHQQLKQAKFDKKNAELVYKKIQEDLRLVLSIAIEECREHKQTLLADEESIQYAQESFLMHQDLLKAGKVTLTEVNDAELLLTRVKLNKEVTLFNINSTVARIEKLSTMEAMQ